MSLKISYRAPAAPPAWPVVVEPPPVVDKSSGRDGAELRRQLSALLANRNLMLRIAALPRLTPEQERLAIAQFRIKNGVTKCPPAYVLPTNNAL
jgi:hypothetical protein